LSASARIIYALKAEGACIPFVLNVLDSRSLRI